jgi:hypothetical protein
MRPLVMFIAAVAAFAQQADYNTGLKNQPGWPTSAYDFTPVSFSGTINAGTYKTFSFSRCPAGVKGSALGPALTVSGTANNGSGLIRITVSATAAIKSQQRVTITGVAGTTEANGNWEAIRISNTQFDLTGSTYTNAWVSGGTVRQNILPLRLSGGSGTAENVLIGGGTCGTPGIAGTIQAYVVNAQGGTYTLQSATDGIMEAIWAQTGIPRRVFINKASTIYGQIWLTTDYILDLYGAGMLNTVLTRHSSWDGDIILMDQLSASTGSVLHTLHDFWINAPSMNAASTSAGIKIRNVTCCTPHLWNIKIWDEINGIYVLNSDEIQLSGIDYLQTLNTAQPVAAIRWGDNVQNYGAASSGGLITNSTLITNEGYASSGVNALAAAILVESYDGLMISNSTLRGEVGLWVNPVMNGSGVLATNLVIDRCRNTGVAIGSQTTGAQGQIVVSNSWITGNYAAGQPLVAIDQTNITDARIIFANNDIAGAQGSCVTMTNAKKVDFHDNHIISCDQGATGKYGIELATAADGVTIHDNTFFDIASLGATTNYAFYFNANVTNSNIHDNNIGAMQSASVLYAAGTNSNFRFTNNVTTESIAGTTIAASAFAYPTNLPSIYSLTGGGTATRVTGMWPGLKFQLITTSATTFNTGGANPGDFARSLTTAAGQMVTFEMVAGGQVYVY